MEKEKAKEQYIKAIENLSSALWGFLDATDTMQNNDIDFDYLNNIVKNGRGVKCPITKELNTFTYEMVDYLYNLKKVVELN